MLVQEQMSKIKEIKDFLIINQRENKKQFVYFKEQCDFMFGVSLIFSFIFYIHSGVNSSSFFTYVFINVLTFLMWEEKIKFQREAMEKLIFHNSEVFFKIDELKIL